MNMNNPKVGDRVVELFTGNDGTVTSVQVIAGLNTYYVKLDNNPSAQAFYADEIEKLEVNNNG